MKLRIFGRMDLWLGGEGGLRSQIMRRLGVLLFCILDLRLCDPFSYNTLVQDVRGLLRSSDGCSRFETHVCS